MPLGTRTGTTDLCGMQGHCYDVATVSKPPDGYTGTAISEHDEAAGHTLVHTDFFAFERLHLQGASATHPARAAP